MEKNDNVNHPVWYTQHPSGIECIDIARWYCFDIGNAIKYLWRNGLKDSENIDEQSNLEKQIQDLEKAVWYINDRIKYLVNLKKNGCKNAVNDLGV